MKSLGYRRSSLEPVFLMCFARCLSLVLLESPALVFFFVCRSRLGGYNAAIKCGSVRVSLYCMYHDSRRKET